MCECFFRFLKCIVVTFNLVLFIVGIAAIAGGAYMKTHIDMKQIVGTQYKENVPPIAEFIPDEAPQDVSDKLTKEADDFVDQSIDDIAGVTEVIVNALIGFGAVMSSLALFGIIVFTCCNKKNVCVITYLVLLILSLIPFLALTIVAGDESILRGHVFSTLDGLALKKKSVNRFFMAALQSQLECCGVRGNVDYFCEGIYDYKCNPGCLTFKVIWDQMKDSKPDMPPMCKREPNLVDLCKTLASTPQATKNLTAENCDNKMNIPKPVDGRKSDFCKAYKDFYKTSADSTSANTIKETRRMLLRFDPAKKYGLDEDPRVFGSLTQEDKGTEGCGFAIWHKVNMPTFLNYAMIAFLVITLIIVFEIFVAALSIVYNKKKQKQESAFTQSKPPSKRSPENSSRFSRSD